MKHNSFGTQISRLESSLSELSYFTVHSLAPLLSVPSFQNSESTVYAPLWCNYTGLLKGD